MSNIDEQLSPHTRRRIPYNQIAGIIDRVIDYDMTPAWYDDKGDFIGDVCDYIVDYFNEDDHIELSPKDKDDFYYYLVDTYGEYLSGYYDQWMKDKSEGLSEQSDRIKSMMGLVETKMNTRLRRRIKQLDDEVERVIEMLYGPEDVCSYGSAEDLFQLVAEDTIDAMKWTYFSDVSDNNTREWVEIYYDMLKYLENTYRDKIKEYYHINCGN
jgi:hypothetical protein